LETDFAEFAGTEAALYFTSGYAAIVGLLSSLLQPSAIVFSDSLNHASIIDGIRLSSVGKVIYEHCDLHALRDKLEQHRSGPGARIIVTESVFSMDGDQAPLSGLLELAEEYDAELIVALLNGFDRIRNFSFGALDGLLQLGMGIDVRFQLFRHLSINLGWLSC
jgi:7-keto-8-aminopelargonate synthetase-like enzyme